MTTPRSLSPRRTAVPACLAGALLSGALLVPACSPSARPASSGTTPSTCVAGVDDVVARALPPSALTAALPSELVGRLDAAAKSAFEGAAAPGAVVGVRTPEGTWIQAYGVADPGTHAPMAAGMHTRIGSVTKTFIGTLLLQLVEKGDVTLEDPIAKYVAGVPNGDRVTLRLLANMTSGVASYTRSEKFMTQYFGHPDTVFTPAELLAVGIAESPLFEPGAKFDYSNTNTILLGLVIEKVTGKPLEDALRIGIIEPLGLHATSWPAASIAVPEPHAQGFTLQGLSTPEKPVNATFWNPSWGWAAGEMISRVDDLLIYGRALGTGQGVLKAETQALRLRSIPGDAGYGIALGCSGGWVGHSGELPGFNTTVFYDTAKDATVVVAVNSDIASGDCAVSPTLTDDTRELPCSSPATRMFVGVSAALGRPFTPNPQR